MTVLKLHSSWWPNSHNKHYTFSSVCFSLPLGQINVIDNLGPCVTETSSRETFFPAIIIILCPPMLVCGLSTPSAALPVHQNVLKFRSGQRRHRHRVSPALGGWELGPTFTQVMLSPDRRHSSQGVMTRAPCILRL